MLPDVCVTEQNRNGNYSGPPVLSVPTDGKVDLHLILRDGYCLDDNAIDLAAEGVVSIKFIAQETADAVQKYINKDVEMADPANGVCRLTLTASDVPFAGIWYSSFVLYDADGNVMRPSRVWLAVQKTAAHRNMENTPLSMCEVRMFLRDKCSGDNFLLDDVEFTDPEIAAAINWAVDEWNETPPDIHRFTQATFPFRRHWLEAAGARLLKMAAYNYERNNLRYNTGGTSVDDKDKAGAYLKLAKDMEEKWTSWMAGKKIELNAQLAYGSVGSWEFNYGRYFH